MNKNNILIVGNTNVGKSLLFNRLCNEDLALVYNKENTTLDYISVYKNDIKITDTAGIINYKDWLSLYGDKLIKNCDLMLYVCDISQPITFDIENLFRELHAFNKPIWIIVNKSDKRQHELFNLYKLRADVIEYVSCLKPATLINLKKMLHLQQQEERKSENLIAIVGRCNAGKSTLLNRILKENRSIVSNVPGTTVDHIAEIKKINDVNITFIDTPGFSNDNTDFMHVVNKRRDNLLQNTFVGQIVVIDGELGVTRQDKHIIDQAQQLGLFTVICVNKYDLITLKVQEELKHINISSNIQVFNISALKNHGIQNMLKSIVECINNFYKLSTVRLNKFLQELKQQSNISRTIKSIKYMTQISVSPIKIMYFSNLILNNNDFKCIKKYMMKYFNIYNYRILLVTNK